MGTWAEIRDGLKTRLVTISGLMAHDTMPSTLPDKDVAVVLYGTPLVLSPSGHARKVEIQVRVIVRVTRATPPDTQDALDAYIWPTGTNSIVAAINAGRTLGGKVDDTRWIGTGSVGVPEGHPNSLQAELNFSCLVSA